VGATGTTIRRTYVQRTVTTTAPRTRTTTTVAVLPALSTVPQDRGRPKTVSRPCGHSPCARERSALCEPERLSRQKNCRPYDLVACSNRHKVGPIFWSVKLKGLIRCLKNCRGIPPTPPLMHRQRIELITQPLTRPCDTLTLKRGVAVPCSFAKRLKD